jgi:hypothetical protein
MSKALPIVALFLPAGAYFGNANFLWSSIKSMKASATVVPEERHSSDIPFNYLEINSRKKYLSMALQPFVGPWPLFHFLDLLHIQ